MEELVVDASWLASRSGESGTRAVDVRDAWEYDAVGHLPEAVNVPFDSFRSESEEDAGHLPGAESFATVAGEAGLSRSDTLVAYDDTNGVFAARFLVTASVYGFEDVRLLDGDFSAWQREHAVETEPVTPPAVDVEARRRPDAETPLVDAEEVRERIDAGDAALVDTRDPDEYAAGHLPGAVRFDWQAAVDPATRGLKSTAAVRERFAELGVDPDEPIVLYCNTARRLSHTYVTLRRSGFTDVAIYEGSLTEWREIGGETVSETG